jgi:hypothetical protein
METGARRDVTEEAFAPIRDRYRTFAEEEAKGVSPLYEALARAVAESEPLLGFIASLPEAKQQPNLVFATVRHLCGTPRDAAHFAELVERHAEPVRALVLRRSTQTNEPGRCAVLLPALAGLPQPLALLEVGASAGLCLLPDRYGYDYGRARLLPPSHGEAPPIFPCRANDAAPIPAELPRIAWRAGLDLNPIDLHDPEETAWLETLVWPGNPPRAERLRAAIRIARERPPAVAKGDLVEGLRAVAATAPGDATLVVFHSAVLGYVSAEDRERFARRVAELGAAWISNESPRVMPEIAAKLASPPPASQFLLAVDGDPVALTGPHGQSIDWLA